MNKLLKLHYLVRTILLFVALFVLILFSIISVYAEPEKTETEPGGWIEAVCTVVPADFEGSVSVMVSDVETDESYTIDCLNVNGFVGRKKIPYGKYFVDRIYTSDTFYYEGFTDLYSFELTKDMAAAKKIEIEVIKNNVPDGVFAMMPGEVTNAEPVVDDEQSDVEASSKGSTTEKNTANDDVTSNEKELERENDVASNDSVNEEGSSDDQRTNVNVLRNLGISLLATVVFVAVISLLVCIARSRYYEEE